MFRIDAIIPFYNEDPDQVFSTASFLTELEFIDKVILINDGSLSSLAEQYRKLSQTLPSSVRYIEHSRNLGKTKAVKTAIGYTTTEYILLNDADKEYLLTNIPNLYAKLCALSPPLGMVVTKRFVPLDQVTFATVIANKLLKLFTCLDDPLSGQRIVHRALLTHLPAWGCFTLETELNILARELKMPVYYCDSLYYPRNYKQGKKIKYFHMIPILALWFYASFTRIIPGDSYNLNAE